MHMRNISMSDPGPVIITDESRESEISSATTESYIKFCNTYRDASSILLMLIVVFIFFRFYA